MNMKANEISALIKKNFLRKLEESEGGHLLAITIQENSEKGIPILLDAVFCAIGETLKEGQ